MKYLPIAASAALAAILMALGSWIGVVGVTVVVALLGVVVAIGWPQLMGVVARRSLSAVILIAGLVAALGAALAQQVHSLFFASACGLAFGVMAVFLLQVLRGTGQPQRLESTLGACAGVVVTTTAAGWVAASRYPASLAGADAQGGVEPLRVRGLLPYEDFAILTVAGHGDDLSVVPLAAFALLAGVLVACLPWRDAIVAPLIGAATCVTAVSLTIFFTELTLLFSGVLGLIAGALLACFRRMVAVGGAPAGLLASLACGAAPIASMGGLVYFTERLLFV